MICQFILPRTSDYVQTCMIPTHPDRCCVFPSFFLNLCFSEDDPVKFKMNAALDMQPCPKVPYLLHLRSTRSGEKSACSWARINFINQQGVLSIYVAIQLMTENGFGVKRKILLLIFTAHRDISFYCLCFTFLVFGMWKVGRETLVCTLWVN